MSEPNQVVSEQPLEQDQQQDQQEAVELPLQFEVTLLVPSQSFAPLAHLANQPRTKTVDGLLEVPYPVTAADAVQELKNILTESPEGFWLGAFGFVPVVADQVGTTSVETGVEGEEPQEVPTYGPWYPLNPPTPDPKAPIADPKVWRLNSEGVLGDFCEIATVFADLEGKKAGLKLVYTSFSPLAINTHVLRFRDTLFGTLPSLSTNVTYDPSTISISSGATLYPTIRGSTATEAPVTTESEVKGKKAGKATKKTEAPAPAAESTEEAPAATESTPHAFTDFNLKEITPYTFLEQLKPATSLSQSSPCVKSLAVSPWSPPPHARKLRGDHLYLVLTTLEGDIFNITGNSSGFWVSKSTSGAFDPLPKVPAPRGVRATPYQSIFELATSLSPLFSKALVKLMDASSPSLNIQTDIYATLPITHGIPAASWIVPTPVHAPDAFRTQLAYLLTTTTSADVLPPARDWNDEMGQYRDLPQDNLPERLLRERLIHRLQCDFATSATRAAVSIVRGDVAPLNPNEPVEAQTYIHNNMLFTRAEDAIKVFGHLGGNEASRVAAAKDIAGVSLLENFDIKGLSTMTTVVIDYLGERWVVQSLIPGLFKTKEEDDAVKALEQGDVLPDVFPDGDEKAVEAAKQAIANDKPFPNMETPNREDYPSSGAFRIVYGSANPEEPYNKIRSSPYFEKIAEAVAEKLNFAKHKVTSATGEVTELWTSADMHGISAPDGKSYFIDCFRLHLTDIEFLENNLNGALYKDATDAQTNGVHDPAPYPHRLTLLRPELVEAFRESKLEKWIEARVIEVKAKMAEDEKAASSVESELKEAAADASEPAGPKVRPPPPVIQASDFKYSFNPDAFLEKEPNEDGTPSSPLYDPEEESTKNVREASKYLRETVLPEFVVTAALVPQAFTDGFFLSKLLHRKGINIRYIGMLADIAEQKGMDLEYPRQTAKYDIEHGLKAFKGTLQNAMVARAAKHSLNRYLRSSNAYDHASVISHFLNCFAGSARDPHPTPELVSLPTGATSSRTWTTLTPASLRQELLTEIEARFRYSLPSSFFEAPSFNPTRLVREVCLRVGIQLAYRSYDFGPAPTANGVHPSSTDDEKPEASTSTTETSSASKKKKKKTGTAKVAEEPVKAQQSTSTFRPDDVLNLMPVTKTTTFKSSVAEDTYAHGTNSMEKGEFLIGQELVQDALNFFEQVYGSVHVESASRFHNLGLMYHNYAQTAFRKLQAHETAEDQLKNLAPDAQPETKKRIAEFLLEDPNVARTEAEQFVQSAVRMLRQSVIIAERTFGLDAPETIQQYHDLSLLENSIGNTDTGLRLAKHALALLTSAHGPNHLNALNILQHVASSVQTRDGVTASIPLLHQCYELASTIYGAETVQAAMYQWSLAQVYALTGNFSDAITSGEAAVAVYKKFFAEDSKELVETANFLTLVKDASGRETREAEERAERLRKKFPRLMENKDLRARVGASSLGHVSKAKGKAPAQAEIVVEPEAAAKKPTYAPKSNLSVDELVSFIQGAPVASSSKTARKRKSSPPAASA
ncbi:hypothetical protein T439DRAFT_303695 [Meredithblackwellia eburnea MCA 4105]